MKTNNLIAQKLAEFDEQFPKWPESQEGAGREIGPLAGVGMYMQYDADREKRDEEMEKIKSFLKSFAKDLLQSVGEEVEGMKVPVEKDGSKYPDARWQRENYGSAQYNKALDDLRTRLKEMEKI